MAREEFHESPGWTTQMTDRRRAGISGMVAVAVALGAGELLAGVFRGVPSPLAAIGSQVVLRVPPAIEDLAIGLFGTADKAALAVGTVIIALIIGYATGIAASRRRVIGVAVFVAFGLFGVAAGLAEPLTTWWAVVAAGLITAASGILTLGILLDEAKRPAVPTDGMPADRDRRRFIGLTAAGFAGAAVVGAVGRTLLARLPETDGAISVGGTTIPTTSLVAAGHDLDLPGLTPIVVPNRDFYRIDTALVVPRIDPARWDLRLTGMVGEEATLTYDDLLAMDHVDRYVTIACVSNEVGGDLVGNALWTGPLLADVLERLDIDPRATQLVGRSVDGWTAGFPTELAFDDREAMIAVAMNGEPLPRRHGYPARLIVPGLYGYVSATKWLTEIEFVPWDAFLGYWIPRGWAKEGPIKLQSRIDVPGSGERVGGPDTTVAGVAWAPTVGISAVEVRVDDGPWDAARLSEPLSEAAWVQWVTRVDLAPGPHSLWVRAIDGDGRVQTSRRAPPRPDGASGHHRVDVVAA
jgi:DMSO/TMAO reductase YedYZ molybdopterin-dependent catalytic subunit